MLMRGRKGDMRKSLIGLLFVLYLSMSFLSNLKVEAGSDWCEIGVSYQAVDGLTVTLHSFQIIEKTGSYQYTITYTLENNTPDKKILEGAFKLYYRDTSGGLPQYGFFDYLYPGDSITRTYTFEELKDMLFDVLEYHHDNFFSDEPLEDSLKWKVVYPDSIPPITQHDYDGAWKNSDFTITLTATDNINRIEEIYYRINDGPIKRVSVDGYPLITNESANNTLEYWSVDWAGNEELPHKILTGIKLDKTLPSISDHSRFPKDNVEPNEPVKVVVNVTDSLSGINNCSLLYRVLGEHVWTVIPMTLNQTTMLYQAIIQIQQPNVEVEYMIKAYDNAGNIAIGDNNGQYYTYTVIPEFPSAPTLLLAIIITSFIVIISKRKTAKHTC